MNRWTRRGVLGLGLIALSYGGWRGWDWMTRRRPDHADLAYGPGPRQKLDLYLPAGPGPFPVVVDIHGGAFKIGDKAMSAPSEVLLAAGIAIARPNYRFSDTDRWPAQGEDILAAVDLLRAQGASLSIDPDRMALWGQSAGAFLAVSTALSLVERGDPPRAVVDFYGPMDFSTMDADMAALNRTAAMGATDDAASAESALLGFAVGADPDAARAAGPIGRLEAMPPRLLPPLFVRHGDADPMIAQGQSERLAAAWTRVNPAAQVDFALVAGGGHGGSAFDADAVMLALRDFLVAALAPSPA